MPSLRIARRATVVLVLGGAAACGSGSTEPDGPAPQAVTITLLAASFSPATASVAVGGTVTFVNSAGVQHDVDFGNPQMHIEVFDAGQRSLAFPAAGRFDFHCNLHAGMEGTLVVR